MSSHRGQLGGSKTPVAYCHLHKFTLSKTQMKNRKCIEKNCDRLQRYENHSYWEADKKRKERLAAPGHEKKEAIAQRMIEYERAKAHRQMRAK